MIDGLPDEATLRKDFGELACNMAAAYTAYIMGTTVSTQLKKIKPETVGMYWVVVAHLTVKDMERFQSASFATTPGQRKAIMENLKPV